MNARDEIALTGLRAMGYHGVLPHERVEGQLFIVDVVLLAHRAHLLRSHPLSCAPST